MRGGGSISPADLPRGKARLKKISLWSKAQDKPRLHICRLLAPGAFRAISGKSIRTSADGFHHFRCRVRMIEQSDAAAE
jgi:hypothetical protein